MNVNEHNKLRMKNLRVVAVAVALMGAMTVLVVYAPTLYQIFCDVTGFGGTVQRAAVPQAEDSVDAGVANSTQAAAADETVTVYFDANVAPGLARSEEHTSELQSLMRISYAVFCLKKQRKSTEQSSKQPSDHTIKMRPANTYCG